MYDVSKGKCLVLLSWSLYDSNGDAFYLSLISTNHTDMSQQIDSLINIDIEQNNR